MPPRAAGTRTTTDSSPVVGNRETVRSIVNLLKTPEKTLLTYHDAARLLKTLEPSESQYGNNWVSELRDSFRQAGTVVNSSLVYRLIKFAELYPGPADRRRIARCGDRVSWDGMIRILTVKDAGERERIIDEAHRKKLSSRAVADLVRQRIGYRKPGGGRPRPPKSSHPNQALRDLRNLMAKWPPIRDAWLKGSDSAIKRTARLKAQKITRAFRDEFISIMPKLRELSESADQLASEFDRLSRDWDR